MILTQAERDAAILEVRAAARTFMSKAAAGRIVDQLSKPWSGFGKLIVSRTSEQPGQGFNGGFGDGL